MSPWIFHEANTTAPTLHFLQMQHSAESNLEIRSHWPQGSKEVGWGQENSAPEIKTGLNLWPQPQASPSLPELPAGKSDPSLTTREAEALQGLFKLHGYEGQVQGSQAEGPGEQLIPGGLRGPRLSGRSGHPHCGHDLPVHGGSPLPIACLQLWALQPQLRPRLPRDCPSVVCFPDWTRWDAGSRDPRNVCRGPERTDFYRSGLSGPYQPEGSRLSTGQGGADVPTCARGKRVWMSPNQASAESQLYVNLPSDPRLL